MQISYKQAADIIRENDNFHILTHQSPDGDTLGSGFALYFALRQLGKKAAVICPDGTTSRYAFLSEGYEEPESFEPDFVIAADIADPGLMGSVRETYEKRVGLCIDHHVSNVFYAEKTLLNGEASAACEVMYNLLKELGVKTDNNIARCLYTGIATDTGCFKYGNTTAQAHRIVAELIGYDIDFARINREMFDIKSSQRIKLEQHILNNMEVYFDGRCAVLVISEELREGLGVPDEDLDGVAGLPLQVRGMEVAVTLKEKKAGEYKISMRSSGRVNVSEICGSLGGGGHKNAAGCSLKGDRDDVKNSALVLIGKARGE
jgi:phosphoesterase RecJ-like protein